MLDVVVQIQCQRKQSPSHQMYGSGVPSSPAQLAALRAGQRHTLDTQATDAAELCAREPYNGVVSEPAVSRLTKGSVFTGVYSLRRFR